MSPEIEARPARWLRLLYRIPVGLHRLGAGGLVRAVGLRWILVVTRGRKSGREHAVVLDLLGEEGNRFYVQAAYGRRADWLQNVEAAGDFVAQVGRRRFTARLEQVPNHEARRVMLAYLEAHPLYSPFIAWMLGYRDSLRSFPAIADWLVDRFSMLAIVRVAS